MARVLLVIWVVLLAYYGLRVSVFALPDSCPKTVLEYTEDARCDDGVLLDWLWFAAVAFAAVTTIAYGAVVLLSSRRT
ncbi:hypothetical protein DSM112329_02851 [Paraconexibacter sp. AEG42_29]|uniref:Uncharacterized protein n=1 Tax=Paraconexibacter sp. AEG42_29 TaxID=2997339 RepID=A0AAU7AWC0_9ACTN